MQKSKSEVVFWMSGLMPEPREKRCFSIDVRWKSSLSAHPRGWGLAPRRDLYLWLECPAPDGTPFPSFYPPTMPYRCLLHFLSGLLMLFMYPGVPKQQDR